jgi:hypothetical protein
VTDAKPNGSTIDLTTPAKVKPESSHQNQQQPQHQHQHPHPHPHQHQHHHQFSVPNLAAKKKDKWRQTTKRKFDLSPGKKSNKLEKQ